MSDAQADSRAELGDGFRGVEGQRGPNAGVAKITLGSPQDRISPVYHFGDTARTFSLDDEAYRETTARLVV